MKEIVSIEDFDLDLLQKDLVVIEDKSKWILKELPKEHPSDPRWIIKWKDLKKKCIEGYWNKDFDGWRYMPGVLFFYINFATIVDTDEVTNSRKKMRPDLTDLEWMFAYEDLASSGFSGFELDTKYSCDIAIIDPAELDYLKDRMIDDESFIARYNALFQSNGQLKLYKHPLEYLKNLHTDNLGKPLYYNESCNYDIFGSRGGGKSYFFAAGKAVHLLLFDGQKHYDLTSDLENKTEICIGSGDTDKSSDFVNKVAACINELATNNRLGCYGSPTEPDYTPNPFYKNFTGSLESGNKQNPYIHKYKMNINGSWNDGFGSLATLYHVSYSTQKKGGSEAAAGGRYLASFIEEKGLTSNCIEVHNSNNATVRAKKQFGSQIGLGTSGNMDLAQGAREMFHHPWEYDIQQHEDIWENSGKIGFFLPAYLADRKFKDKNGNTKLRRALEYYLDRQLKASKSSNPKILEMEKMNYPITPSQMWITTQGHYLPYNEASMCEKLLLAGNKYQKIGKPIQLWWDSSKPKGVDYRVLSLSEVNPFFDYTMKGIRKDTKDLSGCVMMYLEPPANCPNDLFIFCHDPYVAENMDAGGSLGATYGFINPKYQVEGWLPGQLAVSYIGKHPDGLEGYYNTQELILQLYGNPRQGLWYEANRGEYCRGYYIKKKKTNLLCLRPQFEKGSNATARHVQQYGYMVGNKIGKLHLISMLNDWLLEETTYEGETKKNIEWLPDIFLIRQIMLFNLDGNFDAVDCMLGFVLAIKELEHLNYNFNNKSDKKIKNKLAFLANNHKVFVNGKFVNKSDKEWIQNN
jgi:hypothetical protein